MKDAEAVAGVLCDRYGNDWVAFNRLLRKYMGPRGNRYEHDHPDTFMYIERSKNSNIVAYTGKLLDAVTRDPLSSGVDRHGVLNSADPVHAYFVNIDPETVEKQRAAGAVKSTEDLTLLQRKLAYGCKAKPLREVLTTKAKEQFAALLENFDPYVLSYVALPKIPVLLLLLPPLSEDGDMQAETSSTVVQITVIGSELSVGHRIYVSSTEPKHFYQLPTVNYIEKFGVSLESGAETYEKIMN